MGNKILDQEERDYLDNVIDAIKKRIGELDAQLAIKGQEIHDYKRYIWDNIYEMDMIEKASHAQTVYNKENNQDRTEQERKDLQRLVISPYFGRIDFSYDDDPPEDAEIFYIGLRGFSPENTEALVYDWRAPISSMFYDFDEGPASYESPRGTMEGVLRKKRQYKIVDGKMVYWIDSSIKIDDDILQEALSRTTDHQMQNIVATIQKQQNAIIRDDKAKVLVVQGVAGSGKTSIALHRIAYLLYTHRDEINAGNILVISPNHIFSEYISNVLPELGEENIKEMSLDNLLKHELKGIGRVENRFDFLEEMIAIGDEETDRKKTINFKAGMEYLNLLNEYIKDLNENLIECVDIDYGAGIIKKESIKKSLYAEVVAHIPLFKRIDIIVEQFSNRADVHISQKGKSDLSEMIRNKCAKETDVLQIYKNFIKWTKNKTDKLPCIQIDRQNIPYEDAFPIIYLKYSLYGCQKFDLIKHVVIDEMQDYSRIQFEVLKEIFPCNMTILGDVNQAFESKKVTILDVLSECFPEGIQMKMQKTYRSTAEITEFANKIINLNDVDVFQRHGMKPQIVFCSDKKTQSENIVKVLNKWYKEGKYANVAVICKKANEAKAMFEQLNGQVEYNVTLLTPKSTSFDGGVAVVPSYLAKGLEFDTVILPNVDEVNYKSNVDRQTLYVSCTRALHELYLFHTKELTSLI